MIPTNCVTFTAPVNPQGSYPPLSHEHVWRGLQEKCKSGQDFFPSIIASTEVLSTSTTSTGLPVTVIEASFVHSNKKIQEVCTEYWPVKVELVQSNGNKVENIISRDASGALYLTFTFEWQHPECVDDEAKLATERTKEENLAQVAVERTIEVIREMARHND